MTQHNTDRLIDLMKALKLTTMAHHLDEQLATAIKENRSTETVLHRLLEIEVHAQMERRIIRRIKESRLTERKTLDDFDFTFQKGLDRRQIMSLATLTFVRQRQSLLLAGKSGTGKSHIAKSLMWLACGQNIRCRYTTAADMLSDLKSGLVDDTLEEKLKTYVNPPLLCIDEVGFDRLEQDATRPAALFFKVIDGRYGQRSTIFTTNIDFKSLGDYLGDPVMTAAMIDRLLHHAIIIRIQGPSWRLHQSKRLNQAE